MRPVCGCPEKFRESLNTPTATFAEIFNGLLLLIDLTNVRTKFEFVALPICEIIGGTQKMWANITDGQTDRQTDDMKSQYRALH